MPIIEKYKCIFVHIPKVAGTSIEMAFQIPREGTSKELLFGNMSMEEAQKLESPTHQMQHFPIEHIKKVIGEQKFAEYFKFAFVRNPWDKLVSNYFFLKFPEEGVSFEEFIEIIRKKHNIQWLPQYQFLIDESGEIAVDFVGRFENLNADFEKVAENISFSKDRLPQKQRKRHLHYSCYYTPETRDAVANIYKKDIEMFGYQFEDMSHLRKQIHKILFSVSGLLRWILKPPYSFLKRTFGGHLSRK